MAGYGALQDQFTARLCPEYFTVAHQPIPGVTDPTVLGLAWGFLGGWWGGLLLGLGVARAGDIARAVAALLAAVGAVSALACAGNLHNADLLGVSVGEPWASRVPAERHRALVAVANTHFAAYTTTTVGGVVACAWVARRRFGA
jgi:predicted lipid-binding transport protein (Tim44 family)